MPKSKTLTPNFFYLFGTISDSMISQLVKVARAPYSARLATRLFCLGGNHTLAKATLLFCLLLISSSPVLAAFPNDNPVPGGIALVPLKTVMAPKPEVQFGNQSIMVLQNNGRWTAVVGLKRDILPGEYLLTATSEDGSVHSYLFRVNPAPADTPNRIIDLPPKLSDLEFDPDLPSSFIKKMTSNDTEQIESDQSQFASPEQVKHLVPDFEFGQIIKKGRYIPYGLVLTKKEDQNTLIDHSWLTYLTDNEAIILSPGAGLLESVSKTQSNGFLVIVNHGMGMRSAVYNLARIAVKPGQRVKKNTPLGLSAGRADWQLFLNNSSINPLQFSSSP